MYELEADKTYAVDPRSIATRNVPKTGAAPPQNGIVSSVNANTALLMETYQQLSALEGHLMPILESVPEDARAAGRDDPKPGGLADLIAHQRRLIAEIAVRIDQIRQRLML